MGPWLHWRNQRDLPQYGSAPLITLGPAAWQIEKKVPGGIDSRLRVWRTRRRKQRGQANPVRPENLTRDYQVGSGGSATRRKEPRGSRWKDPRSMKRHVSPTDRDHRPDELGFWSSDSLACPRKKSQTRSQVRFVGLQPVQSLWSIQAMIAQGGRTTQRVVPLSRLGESSDFLDSLSRASPTLTSPPSHLRAVARPHSEKIKAILFGTKIFFGTTKFWQWRQRNASQTAARLALERPAQHEASRVTDRS